MDTHPQILVAYATKYGATVGIANAIGEELQKLGRSAEARLAKNLKDLGSPQAVIVGSPVYVGSWLKEATQFVVSHRAALAQMPTAFFTVGLMQLDQPEEARQEHLAAIEKVRQAVPEVEPVDLGMFTGAFDKSKVGFFARLMMSLKKTKEGDFRDWEAIRSWVTSVEPRLRVSQARSKP